MVNDEIDNCISERLQNVHPGKVNYWVSDLPGATSYPGLSTTSLVQGEDGLHFDWLIKKQCAKSKILESREIIFCEEDEL